MFDMMSNCYDNCNKCTKNNMDESVSKQVQVWKRDTINVIKNFIKEINTTIIEVGKLYNEFKEHEKITMQIYGLKVVENGVMNIREQLDKFAKKTNEFNCSDCKKICEIEDFLEKVDHTLAYLNTAENGITQILLNHISLVMQVPEKDEIDKRIKEIFEDDHHFEKMMIQYSYFVNQLDILYKTIIEGNLCPALKGSDGEKLLKIIKKDILKFEQWSKFHNMK